MTLTDTQRLILRLMGALIVISIIVILAISLTSGMSKAAKVAYFVTLGVVVCVLMFAVVPPIRQPLSYHLFADDRTLCCGVPNTFDVIVRA